MLPVWHHFFRLSSLDSDAPSQSPVSSTQPWSLIPPFCFSPFFLFPIGVIRSLIYPLYMPGHGLKTWRPNSQLHIFISLSQKHLKPNMLKTGRVLPPTWGTPLPGNGTITHPPTQVGRVRQRPRDLSVCPSSCTLPSPDRECMWHFVLCSIPTAPP